MEPERLIDHANFVRALSRVLVADEHDAADVEQQAWLASLTHPPREPAKARSWLAAVVANFARRMRRDRATHERHELAAARSEALPSTVDLAARRASLQGVVAAVFALDEPYCAVVLLRFYDGLKPGAIARQLGVPVETVRTRLKRALAQLREKLDAQHGGRRDEWLAVLLPWASGSTIGVGTSVGTSLGTVIKVGAAATLAALATGVVVMGAKGKLAAVGLALVASGVGAWKWLGEGHDAAAEAAPGPLEDARLGTSLPADVSTNDVASDASSAAADLAARRTSEMPSELAAATPTIRGRVVDDAGQPVARARVVAYLDDQPAAIRIDVESDPPGSLAHCRTDSDERGEFELAVDRARVRYELAASKEGFFPAIARGGMAGGRVELKLAAAWSIVGRVLDLESRPIGDAQLTLRIDQSGRAWDCSARSGDDGSYRVSGVAPPDAFSIGVIAQYLTAEQSDFAPLMIGPMWASTPDMQRREYHHDLYLGRGATLRGRVVDAETGEPLAAADVQLETYFGGWNTDRPGGGRVSTSLRARVLRASRSALDGTFALEHIPANTVEQMRPHVSDGGNERLGRVGAWAPGYAPATEDVSLPDEGSDLFFELRCPAAAQIEGRVVTADGQPLAGKWVGVVSPVALGRLATLPDDVERAYVCTDADGRYSLRAAVTRDGTPLKLSVRCGDGDVQDATHHLELSARAGASIGAADFVLSHRDAPSAKVRVVDETGGPIAGADVRLWTRGGGDLEPERTGPDGTVALRNHNDSELAGCRVIVRAAGYAIAVSKPFDLASEPPQVEVVLHPEHLLTGFVRTPGGAPARGAYVWAIDGAVAADRDAILQGKVDGFRRRDDGSELPVWLGKQIVDSDGSFSIGGLPPPPWHVVASREDGRNEYARVIALDVRDEREALLLELPLPPPMVETPTASVDVGLADAATGKPILRVQQLSLHQGEASCFASPIAPGRWRFDHVPLGRWKLLVNVKGYVSPPTDELALDTPDARVERTIALDPGATVRGRVRIQGGGELQPGGVIYLEGLAAPTQKGELNGDGSFSVSGLRAGEQYHVKFVAASETREKWWWMVLPDDVVTAGADGTLADRSLTIVPASAVSVFVACKSLPHQPVANDGFDTLEQKALGLKSTIVVSDAQGHEVARTRRVGQQWNGLVVPQGEWTLTVTIPGYAPRSQPLVVTADSPQHFEVHVEEWP